MWPEDKWTVGDEEQSRLITVNTPDTEYTVLAKRIDDGDMYSLEEYSETSCFVENASRRR